MSEVAALQNHDRQGTGKEERQKSLIKHIRQSAATLSGLPLPNTAKTVVDQIYTACDELLDLYADSLDHETVMQGAAKNAANAGKKMGPALNPGLALHKGRQYAHILIAEDNKLTRTLALNMIEQQGWRATAVESGREALEAVGHEQFDLVIMDVYMADMNGIEATRIIREMEKRNEGGPRLPIIALTGLDSKEDREICLKAGMDEFISKAMHLNDLIVAIGRQLAKPYIAAQAP